MNAQTATAPGAASTDLRGQHTLTTPVGTAPLRFYRKVFVLRFPTGGAAERIVRQHGDDDADILDAGTADGYL